MIIKNSQVELYSQSQAISKHSTTTNIEKYYGLKNEDANLDNSGQAYSLSFEQSYSFSSIQTTRAVYDSEDSLSLEDRIKKLIIEMLLGNITNNKNFSMYPEKKIANNVEVPLYPKTNQSNNPYNNTPVANNTELKATVFETKEEYYEKQSIDFSAKVKFNTPNKSYEMNLDISFSKELYESSSIKIITGDKAFVDPLIINFAEDVNPFDNIGSLKFAFDLDSNGDTEMIPYLKQGAGYLAIDKNDNGIIDNGTELFGPQTNNGFAELSLYDKDKNGFIDEQDEVFNKLKVWSIDESGNSSLISLFDANVGAIYLGDIQSGFTYKDSISNTQALQKSNGVFIKEDGSGLGVVNSIDVVV